MKPYSPMLPGRLVFRQRSSAHDDHRDIWVYHPCLFLGHDHGHVYLCQRIVREMEIGIGHFEEGIDRCRSEEEGSVTCVVFCRLCHSHSVNEN